MGNSKTKVKLTADEEWLEKKNCSNAGIVSANRWRNPHKIYCPAWQGKCTPDLISALKAALQKELFEEKSQKKKAKRVAEWQLFKAWEAENNKRSAKRAQKQENKDKQKAAGEEKSPPPYAPSSQHTHTAAAAAAPSPTSPLPVISPHNSFRSDPYTEAKHRLNFMTKHNNYKKEGTVGQFPMVALSNPRFGQPSGPADGQGNIPIDDDPLIYAFRPWSHKDRENVLKDVPPLNEGFQPWRDAVELIRRGWGLNGHEMMQVLQDLLGLRFPRARGQFTGNDQNGDVLGPDTAQLGQELTDLYNRVQVNLAPRPDYGKIGECKQKDGETASDYLDRLRPVFRQNSGLNHDPNPQSAFQQQLKNAFLNGLLPKIKAHVDKHWVTQNTGTLPDALQYAEHAVKVQKQKEKTEGVFMIDPETGFIAFSGQQKQTTGFKPRKGKQKAGQRRDRRDMRCYNCGKNGHFARDCRSVSQEQESDDDRRRRRDE
ncbi:uncharacterized protein LOC120731354 [Simochromis diagramma]|uniref:uncharacterized protein LOC120731354 n=1 Tax=Simochromis diagramma TaxID=43689 RepID=UPI001A7EFB0C|nr:uncharacterized protein LOC120731354 [Simochromis diagramma]